MPLTTVTSLKKGSYIMIDNEPCVVKNIDISKTGKHGASKARVEAVGIIDGQKRIIVKPGHENITVPIIDKRKAQVLSVNDLVTVMDLETFETLSIKADDEVKEQITEGKTVEYWKIEDKIIIKRLL
ncbi:MAG: translation initiation factor IF-5A [Nanoarchaeota archaeon]